MSYIDNCEKYKSTIIDNFEEAQNIKGILSQDLIDKLVLFQFNNTKRVKWSSTSRNIQPIVNIDNIFKDIPEIKEIFNELIGDFYKYHTGNFYITTMLHDAHVDLLTEQECNTKDFEWTDNIIPYKSAIIPLLVNDDADAYTAFFRERHIGYSVTFDKAGYSYDKNSDYNIAREYPKFYRYGENRNSEFLMRNPLVPKKNVEDFDYENIFKFKPGNIMLFDACQIHMSVIRDWKTERDIDFLKNRINIQFYREVND